MVIEEAATARGNPNNGDRGRRRGLSACSEAVSYRGLFTAGWFGVREKHCSQLEIYDRLRASE